jgi:hypothetical protein
MIPNRLFRFFKERDHAQEFVDGRIRIGLMSVYRNIEDARRDELEGTSSLLLDKPATEYIIDNRTGEYLGERTSSTEKHQWSGEFTSPLYLLCTSSGRANKKIMASKIGNFMVEINDTSGLLALLRQSWGKYPCSLNGEVELKKVIYNRGALVKPNKYLRSPYDISIFYTQKSAKDKDDYEYRFIFFCRLDYNIDTNNLEDFVYLDIPIDNNVIRKEILIMAQPQAPIAPES